MIDQSSFQLNYQFLKKCVESAPITPMQDEYFENILKLIPDHLQVGRDYRAYIKELFEEVNKDFDKSMKKSQGRCPKITGHYQRRSVLGRKTNTKKHTLVNW